MEKEKALKVMETIDCCVVPLSIAGGVRLGLNTYDIYRKCTGTKFRLTEALVFGLVCAPLGMYAANVYGEYVSKPMRKGIESVHKKEDEKNDDIPEKKEKKDLVDTAKEKTEVFKKDIEEMFGDIMGDPVKDLSQKQLHIETGKAAALLKAVKSRGGEKEEIERAEDYLYGIVNGIRDKKAFEEWGNEFRIKELREKYQPELYSHEVSEEE